MSASENRAQRRRREAIERESGKRTVIFRRVEGWYPLELPLGEDLARHAELNPGTLRIEDAGGNILWMPQ